jgi:hypothetical protein
MAQAAILPDPTQVELVTFVGTTTGITAVARTRTVSTLCPVCGARSERMHSRYARRVADLPWCGMLVNDGTAANDCWLRPTIVPPYQPSIPNIERIRQEQG